MVEQFYLEDSVVACHFESGQFIGICLCQVHVSDANSSTLNTLVLRISNLVFRPIALLFQIFGTLWVCLGPCWISLDLTGAFLVSYDRTALGRWTAWHPLHSCHLLLLVLAGNYCWSPVTSSCQHWSSVLCSQHLFSMYLHFLEHFQDVLITHVLSSNCRLFIVCPLSWIPCIVSCICSSTLSGIWRRSQEIWDLLGWFPSKFKPFTNLTSITDGCLSRCIYGLSILVSLVPTLYDWRTAHIVSWETLSIVFWKSIKKLYTGISCFCRTFLAISLKARTGWTVLLLLPNPACSSDR